MADKTIRLQIITPAHKKADEDADMVIMRCTTGNIGILPGHEARSAVLDFGILRIINDGRERWIAVYGGLAVIQNDVLTVLANDAQWPDEIDIARAQADREQLELRLRERNDEKEIRRDQILLRRALVQIEISSSTLAGGDEEDDM